MYRVLISAYACEPHKGSEQGVGWNWALQIARFYDVWVITRTNNREVIESYLSTNPVNQLHFRYVDVPRWISFWKRKARGLYPYYILWQIWAFRFARKLHRRYRFDVCHHLTFGTVWLPTFMPFLGIPFIWGPIGGAEKVPGILRPHLSLRMKIYERLRDVLVKLTFSFNPLIREAAKRARLVIARTKITSDALVQLTKSKTALMIETGVSKYFLEKMKKARRDEEGKLILMAGRLLHWKGFDLGIDAFIKVSSKFPKSALMIIGTGPEEIHLKSIARKLPREGKIVFSGQLSRDEVLKTMGKASIFLMPSMKDAGAWVIFEAMASSLPLICLDYAGPGEIVDNSCAIRIPLGERGEVVSKIADALEALLSSKTLRENMGRAAINRLKKTFLWDCKGERIREFYEMVLSSATAIK